MACGGCPLKHESFTKPDAKKDEDNEDAADAEMDDAAAPHPTASKNSDDEEEEEEAPAAKKRKGGPGGRAGARKRPKKEESDEDVEEESEDDEEEKVYAACTPLSGAVSTSTDAASPVGGTHPLERTDGTRLFYGHDGYYMLFRLHQHLYERLSTARASAASLSRQFGQKAEPESVRAAKAREIHDEFLRLFFKLLNGQVESSAFEDDCRALLGANSYVLFTLDKLVFKIVKQIQALAQDETAAKLRRLAEYEKARAGAFSEAVYHANASVLLMDEPCYRIGSVRDGAGLGLRLVESGLDKSDLPAGTMEAQFHEYLEGFLNTAADDEDENAAPWQDLSDRPEVYLPRSKVVAGFVDENGEDAGRMGSVSVHNSLECKISCSNSKVSYVLDTEDVFHRRAGTGAGARAGRGAEGKAAVVSRAEKKAEKFQRWQAEKFAAMPPPEDEAAKAAKAEAEAVPDFATAAAAAMLTDVEAKEEAEEDEAEEKEENEEDAAEEGEGDDAAGDDEVAADEEMEDAQGGDE